MTAAADIYPNHLAIDTVVLNYLSVLRFSGADARSFLHKQLTCSIEDLRNEEVRYTGYCNPKGRLLATGLVFQDSKQTDTWWWVVRTDVALLLAQRLKMFVLRAKVEISLTSQMRISGCFSSDPLTAAGSTQKRWTRQATEGGHRLDLPCANPTKQSLLNLPVSAYRYLTINEQPANFAELASAESQSTAQSTAHLASIESLQFSPNPADAPVWSAHDQLCGIVWIGQANQERFIPQTVNLDLNGGVSFAKGCYPGQEIVARTHYLGKIKRRALLAQGFDLPNQDLEGFELFKTADPTSPVARVINSCRLSNYTLLLLESQENSWRSHEASWMAALEPNGEPYSFKWMTKQQDPFETATTVTT